MASNQDLQVICDRLTQAAAEFKQHAIKLANLEREVAGAQSTLAGLQAKIAQAQLLAVQIEELDQTIRQKRSELADLDAIIQKKHLDHGSITSALRDLRKQISGDSQHPQMDFDRAGNRQSTDFHVSSNQTGELKHGT